MDLNVLFLTDHPHAKTGVGTVTKSVLENGRANYDVIPRQAVREDEQSYESLGVAGLRRKLEETDPDILFLFGDPGLFGHVFEAEHEIRSNFCPIAWYHVWDNRPVPSWNSGLYESVDAVLSASRLTDEVVREQGFGSQYVPHGVDTEKFFVEDDPQYFGELEGAPVVTYVGRNQHRKNLVTLVKAFADADFDGFLALRTNPRGAYDLPGAAEYYGIADRTYFYPELQTEMLCGLYNRTNLVVNPAYREGFGLPTVEAGFCGCGRASASTGGLADQIEDLRGHMEVLSYRSYNGEQGVPAIAEDRVDVERLSGVIETAETAPDRELIADRVSGASQYTAKKMAHRIEETLKFYAENAEKPNRYFITT